MECQVEAPVRALKKIAGGKVRAKKKNIVASNKGLFLSRHVALARWAEVHIVFLFTQPLALLLFTALEARTPWKSLNNLEHLFFECDVALQHMQHVPVWVDHATQFAVGANSSDSRDVILWLTASPEAPEQVPVLFFRR